MGRPRKKENLHLPKHMIVRTRRPGCTHYYYVTPDAKRKEIPLGSDMKEAMCRYAAMVEPNLKAALSPDAVARTLFQAVVKNARTRGIAVQVTQKDIRDLFHKSGGRCMVTGIMFDFAKRKGQRIRPWMPSVDRIDPSKGYGIENVRIVCAAVNVAMNQFGDDVFFRICTAAVRKMSRRSRDQEDLRSKVSFAE